MEINSILVTLYSIYLTSIEKLVKKNSLYYLSIFDRHAYENWKKKKDVANLVTNNLPSSLAKI